MLKEIEFLGHIVSAKGVAVDPRKTKVIKEWPQPTSVTEVRSFLGMANYYKKFVKEFAQIAGPLTYLLKKGVPLEWKAEQEKAFSTLKQKLVEAPVLRTPDFKLPFVVTTDASDYAIGQVLQQDDGNGLRPVAYESRKLTPAEKNYAIHEKELLAIIHIFKV